MFNSLKEITLAEYQKIFENDFCIHYFKLISFNLIKLKNLSKEEIEELKKHLIRESKLYTIKEIQDLSKFNYYFFDDLNFTLSLLQSNPYFLDLVPEDLKKDESFMLKYLSNTKPYGRVYIDKSINYSEGFIDKVTSSYLELLYLLPKEKINKKNFENFVERFNYNVEEESLKFKIDFDIDWLKDETLFLKLINKGYYINYNEVPRNLIYNTKFIFKVAKNSSDMYGVEIGYNLFFQNITNTNLLKKVILKYPYVFTYIKNNELQSNVGFIKRIIKIGKNKTQKDIFGTKNWSNIYLNIDKSLVNNIDLGKFFLELNLNNFNCLSYELMQKKEIIEIASKKFGTYKPFGIFVYEFPNNKASLEMVKNSMYAYAPLNKRIKEGFKIEDSVLRDFYKINPKLILFESISNILDEKDFYENITLYPENIVFFLDNYYDNHKKIFDINKYMSKKNFIINTVCKKPYLIRYFNEEYISFNIISECLIKNKSSFPWLKKYISKLSSEEIFNLYNNLKDDKILELLMNEENIDYFEFLLILGKISIKDITNVSIRKKIMKIMKNLLKEELI